MFLYTTKVITTAAPPANKNGLFVISGTPPVLDKLVLTFMARLALSVVLLMFTTPHVMVDCGRVGVTPGVVVEDRAAGPAVIVIAKRVF